MKRTNLYPASIFGSKLAVGSAAAGSGDAQSSALPAEDSFGVERSAKAIVPLAPNLVRPSIARPRHVAPPRDAELKMDSAQRMQQRLLSDLVAALRGIQSAKCDVDAWQAASYALEKLLLHGRADEFLIDKLAAAMVPAPSYLGRLKACMLCSARTSAADVSPPIYDEFLLVSFGEIFVDLLDDSSHDLRTAPVTRALLADLEKQIEQALASKDLPPSCSKEAAKMQRLAALGDRVAMLHDLSTRA